jgi:hypothetical protein
MNDEEPHHDDAANEAREDASKEDADIYFFNPWDRHLKEDFKAAMNKFEFRAV